MEELKLINEIRKRAGKPDKGVKCGIGDDCAVLNYDKKKYLLWATDMLVEGTHFRLKKTPYKKIGRKAVAINISDIAAMAGVPKYILVTIGIPRGTPSRAIRSIYDGIFEICKEYGIKVVGGDTNASDKLVIDVSILGIVEKRRMITRSGAKPGELILITGPVRDGKKEHLDFRPRLEEARSLTRKHKIGSMIDTSDGIAPDLARVCSRSGTGCRLYTNAIRLSKGLSLKDALYYGESFELLFTMEENQAKKLLSDKWGQSLRGQSPFICIGEITHKKSGLLTFDKRGRVSKLKTEGFIHL